MMLAADQDEAREKQLKIVLVGDPSVGKVRNAGENQTTSMT